MIRKFIVVLAILTLTATPALARGGGGGGFHGGGGGFHGGGFHGGGFHGGGFHGGGGFQGGGGFRGGFNGGGFHGGGGFRGNGFRGREFGGDHFHRFGFFGDFGFVGPVVGFGVDPFFWDPFWFPSPYPAYTYAPPLVIERGPQEVVQQPTSPATTYWYYCADANAYYPYIQQCAGGWRTVPATPIG